MTTLNRRAAALCAAIFALAVLMSCRDAANTVAGPPPPVHPPSSSNIAGTWRGTMQAAGCNEATTVRATIEQVADTVTGTLKQEDCIETFGRLDFTGTYRNGRLSGTTTGDFPGRIEGVLEDTELGIHAYTKGNFDMGPMTLQKTAD